jgi:hypothetical protein
MFLAKMASESGSKYGVGRYSMRRIRQRKTKTDRGKGEYTVYSISIPEKIASKIPEGMRFDVELTEEGLLFRPILPKKESTLPSWVKI